MDIKSNQLNGIYKEIAEVLGVKVAIEMHENFKGLQVTFPLRLLDRNHVINTVKQEYNGKNAKELARRYGYTERWIVKLAKEDISE